jgi:hypothetical protein
LFARYQAISLLFFEQIEPGYSERLLIEGQSQRKF